VTEMIGELVLDRYRIDAELGRGTMGAVYRGAHFRTDRAVAIKVMHEHHSVEPQMIARFRREARIAGMMIHPNVIGLIDFGITDTGRAVMVMEYAVGATLSSLLAVPPAPRRMVSLARGILRGLEHAHGVGLIHRDLKPDNVIVEISSDGTEIPRIVDFGIAVLRDHPEHGAGKLTATGQIVGTPLYMAPEQAQGDPIDHRVDLFALGVIVYQMLAGRPPFLGSSIEIQLAYITKDPPPVASFQPGVDPLLEAFARKLMARKLDARFASATDALRVLDLIETDRREAGLALGLMDVSSALDIVKL